MQTRTFIKGTIILIAAGLATRILGFINRIVTANILGAEGIGLYNMAFPTLLLIITLTQLGLPVAISKLTAEAVPKKDTRKMKQILVISLTVTGVLSVLFTILLVWSASFFAEYFVTDERALYSLLAITPIIPAAAVSAVLRGYFQGKQNMKPTAMSQVIEQIVRISLVAVCTNALLPYGLEFAAAGAMLSVAAGEGASLLYLMRRFTYDKPLPLRRRFFHSLKSGGPVFQDLMTVALPATGSRLVGSVTLFMEPIIIAHSLALAGYATAAATAQYGELSGFVIPLLLLPTFITHSFSVSLVPAVSEAAAAKDYGMIQRRLRQTLRTGLIAGSFCACFLFVFARPIMDVMYDSPESAYLLQIMAPFSLFLYMQGPLQAVLQGLNLARTAMFNTLSGAIIKMSLLFLFTSQPALGISGAALAIAVNMVLVTLLHFRVVTKAAGLILEGKAVLFIPAAAACSVFGINALLTPFEQTHPQIIQLTTATAGAGLIFAILLWTAGFFKWSYWRKISSMR
ncbi:stage V sporulation protein B [Salibacterium halotolerans]|uniref:Stage V sporulation protein B n=1 Tax=Salibacterium halotolerans TaxID=1884432 RepID=A0A1I5UEJ1_9BACI|nr:stage V sporulation protein B [Salibacterium halotolerans]SFP93700.1 stage V sporulation protein B [Salibacterium halotolerans]